jgi:hypothetical protein
VAFVVSFIDSGNFRRAFASWGVKGPFDHIVIDNFFLPEVVERLAKEFPASDSELFNGNYNNALEIKRTCNIWDRFPPFTYQVLTWLNSDDFLDLIAEYTGIRPLYSDPGLHGGGWHTHPPGGKLNVHKDYNLHPKLGLQRKFNLLVYLNPEYQPHWGGELGLWDQTPDGNPGHLIQAVEPRFNRAVLFDTTQNSWHGLEIPNRFPLGQDRKSIAIYYLTDPPEVTENRMRALFAPSEEQKHDPEVLELIRRRSQTQGHDPELWSRR